VQHFRRGASTRRTYDKNMTTQPSVTVRMGGVRQAAGGARGGAPCAGDGRRASAGPRARPRRSRSRAAPRHGGASPGYTMPGCGRLDGANKGSRVALARGPAPAARGDHLAEVCCARTGCGCGKCRHMYLCACPCMCECAHMFMLLQPTGAPRRALGMAHAAGLARHPGASTCTHTYNYMYAVARRVKPNSWPRSALGLPQCLSPPMA